MPIKSTEIVNYKITLEATQATKEAEAIKRKFREVGDEAGRMNVRAKKVRKGLDEVGDGFRGAGEKAKGFVGRLNLVRIAAGALVAMGLFRTIQFIEESFRAASDAAKELELSMFRLVNTEKILSEQGVEVSLEGLKGIISDIKELLPIFSREDITKQVSLIGIMTKELNLSEKQMLDLATSIAAMNIKSADSEDLLTTTNRVLQSIVSKGAGIGSLGVKFSEAAIRAKAVELGLLDADKSLSDLDDSYRDFVMGQAKVAIAIGSTEEELKNIDAVLDTNFAKLERNKSAWNDLLATIGSLVNTLLPAMDEFFSKTQKAVEVESIRGLFASLLEGLEALDPRIQIIGTKLLLGAKLTVKEYERLQEVLSRLSEQEILNIFPDPSAIKDRFTRELVQSLVDMPDTPTGAIDNLADSMQELSETDLEDLLDDLDKLNQKIADAERDFATGLARFDADFVTKRNRLNEDFAIRREGIIRSSNKKISDIQTKSRQRELNAEAKFQEQMRQLREKFLFNLEDALRDRDARQVLRLQRQFEMDRTALSNEHDLQEKERATDTAQQIQDAIAARDERLRLLDEERQLKLARQQADFELSRARKEEDHAQDMADLQRQVDEKLVQFAEDAAEELGLKEGAAKLLYETLKKYYGAGGLLDGLFGEARQIQVGHAAAMIAEMNNVLGHAMVVQTAISSLAFAPVSTAALTGANNVPSGLQSIGPQADGGTYFADRPTHAIFGEAGPEIASFTPVSKMRSGGGASQGGVESLSLRVSLDPDLEARIVDSSLDNVSAVIEQVQGER